MHTTTFRADVPVFVFHRHYEVYCRCLVGEAFGKFKLCHLCIYCMFSLQRYYFFVKKSSLKYIIPKFFIIISFFYFNTIIGWLNCVWRMKIFTGLFPRVDNTKNIANLLNFLPINLVISRKNRIFVKKTFKDDRFRKIQLLVFIHRRGGLALQYTWD